MCVARLRHVGTCPEDAGYRAYRDGTTVLCKRMPRLFEGLEMANGDGRFPPVPQPHKPRLLILDDWGPDRLTAAPRRDLMDIVEDRYGRGSTMITNQLPIKAWHGATGEPAFADAILDGNVYNAYRLDLEGQSMRKTIANMNGGTPET
ncbi:MULTISPECIES: ATP-binding protein [unclassified Leisingera]|uniref:ATP-binding protein n=1 Tax=unclassified Leisingera TaxID=2614906 RepID=UPI001FFD8894|nr:MULTISPECIES: ATP-binding protein [unclassified Leisingera]